MARNPAVGGVIRVCPELYNITVHALLDPSDDNQKNRVDKMNTKGHEGRVVRKLHRRSQAAIITAR